MTRTTAALVSILLALVVAPGAAQDLAPTPGDSCIACHSDPDFLVTNKKLYDYFQSWRASLHGQAGVSCSDCHGGRPSVRNKDAAHGSDLEAARSGSAVNFRNIPETCGRCHDDQLTAYQESRHATALKQAGQSAQGPNCVTCHGSLNAQALNVTTVRATCQQCHNDLSGNRPEIPNRAEHLLNDLNAIRGYRRFASRRASAELLEETLGVFDSELTELARRWHTFDLEAVSAHTATLLSFATETKERLLEERAPSQSPPSPAPGDG